MLKRARAYSSMISIVPEAMVATEEGVRRMHDPTEGGVIGGLRELAEANGLALRAKKDRIRVSPETEAICNKLEIDPLILMSSGSLLCVVPQEGAERLSTALCRADIDSAVIGRVEGVGSPSLVIESDRGDAAIDEFPTDEIWRILS
jgi:hydrogenase maturation factor